MVRIPPYIQNPSANDPQDLDLDAACVTMLTLDLPALFGIMAHPTNHIIHVRDLPGFSGWLHVISDPIVIKVLTGSNDEHMEVFKASLVDILRTEFGITLTSATNSCTLSTSQVNIPVAAMSEALYTVGARLCRISFFEMKMSIPSAEPVIDNFIRRYRDQMGATVPTGRNLFDYGTRYPIDVVQLFKFSEEQHVTRRCRADTLHEMCNEPGYGSIECSPTFDRCMSKVKVY